MNKGDTIRITGKYDGKFKFDKQYKSKIVGNVCNRLTGDIIFSLDELFEQSFSRFKRFCMNYNLLV